MCYVCMFVCFDLLLTDVSVSSFTARGPVLVAERVDSRTADLASRRVLRPMDDEIPGILGPLESQGSLRTELTGHRNSNGAIERY